MAKTISEICIANTGGDKLEASYEAAGYHNKYGKLEEFAIQLKSFTRNDGALALVAQILATELSEFDKVKLAEQLLAKTRLLADEQGNQK